LICWRHTEDTIDLKDYVLVIQDVNAYHPEIYIDGNGFSNGRVFDPKEVKKEHMIRSDISYFPFTKKQLLTAGEPDFVERNKSYMELVNYLTKNYEIAKVEADGIAEECVYATRIGHGPNDVLEFLSHSFEFSGREEVQALMDKVIQLMNNRRQWFLKGYTS